MSRLILRTFRYIIQNDKLNVLLAKMPTPTSRNSVFRRCSDLLSCRQVLNIMVLLGFMFNYMLRVNLTIAIVAMVVPGNATGLNGTDANAEPLEGTRYDWDPYLQNIILGCFFWGYICTELPGGRLAEVFGARRIFGYSMLSASILTLLTPVACSVSHIAVIALRVVLGFMLGATWPAIPPMSAKWIPPMERSKFMANMMASSLGAALTMPACGYLIVELGWESVFYVTGMIGVLWSVMWFVLIYDSPAEHPRISAEERAFIEDSIGTTSNKGKALAVPWKCMLSSFPVWAIIVTHGCSVFGYFTVVNQLPTFTKYILHYNIKENGMLSSLPYFGKYLMAVFTSYLADYLRKSGKLTTTATRKIFTAFAELTPGLLMLVQVYLGHDRVASIAIFTLALTINGAVTAGYLSNGLDIAPNFSGTIFGLANTLSSLGGFLSTLMVGTLTKDNQTYGQWQVVFWILSATYIFGGLTFVIFGTGELQSWNSGKHGSPGQAKKDENIPLQSGNGKV
ncbi:UNVERIFIED_CONTAM: hypothetical protein PYX00_003443 [Menopon gallinae]|uniref:Major facilitator superfamily (MFS) profile domain-containing protein n=1 Tax=Menopon gallinae TaxID=328185 RepID=A0AAW2I1K2_9NEOP